jgi:hypothetical protein
MPIEVNIFSARILDAMHHPSSISVNGQTVGECLADLIGQYPDIRPMIFDRADHFRREVFVYINLESLHKVELTRPVKANDRILVAVMVSGG